MKGIIPVLPSHRCILYIIFECARRGLALIGFRKSELPERCCRAGICVDVETAWEAVHVVLPQLEAYGLVRIEQVTRENVLVKLTETIIRIAAKSRKLDDFVTYLKLYVTSAREELVGLVYSIMREVVEHGKHI